jgi:hypothetical protein
LTSDTPAPAPNPPARAARDPEKWKPVFGQDHAQTKEHAAARFVGKCEAHVTAGTAKSKHAAGGICVRDRGKSLERLMGKMPLVCLSGTGF